MLFEHNFQDQITLKAYVSEENGALDKIEFIRTYAPDDWEKMDSANITPETFKRNLNFVVLFVINVQNFLKHRRKDYEEDYEALCEALEKEIRYISC